MVEELIKDLAKEIVQESMSGLFRQIKGSLNLTLDQFSESFQAYCLYMYEKNSSVRTLFSKNKPMQLMDLYVRTSFSNGEQVLDDTAIIKKFGDGNRIVVKGNGGSGKTFFLRYLWLTKFAAPSQRIPIYLELRRVNDLKTVDLLAFCRAELQSEIIFGDGRFEELCREGKFEFIFDGFDEVSRNKRKAVEQQILEISERYRDCSFLVSGREDDRFSSWGPFEVYDVQPLSLEDVRSLIERIPFDKKVKKKFLGTLNEEFYEAHNSFLSSPLLAIMMLMTFNENAVIPRKLTSFYRDAFQTLLTWHDATKDSFERERGLEVDDFRKVFSTFCLMSYYDQAIDFDEQSLRNYITKALAYHKIEVSVDEVKEDFCEAVNLIQKDGLKYIFVHRSFQEYFAAECAMHTISGKANDFLDVFSRRPLDAVFAMCYEIHPELVYDEFLSELAREIEKSSLANASDSGSLARINEMRPELEGLFEGGSVTLRRLRYGTAGSEKETTVLAKMELFNLVCDGAFGRSPLYSILTNVFSAIDSAISDKKMEGKYKEYQYRISIKIRPEKTNISLRHDGGETLKTRDLQGLKELIATRLEPALQKSEEEVLDYVEKALGGISSIRKARESKEKSIDAILGLT